MSDTQQTDETNATALPHPGYVWVRSGLTGDDRDRVALSEEDPLHPENADGKHEIWIAGHDGPPVKAAKTPTVLQHLRDGELVEVAANEETGGKPAAEGTTTTTTTAAPTR